MTVNHSSKRQNGRSRFDELIFFEKSCGGAQMCPWDCVKHQTGSFSLSDSKEPVSVMACLPFGLGANERDVTKQFSLSQKSRGGRTM